MVVTKGMFAYTLKVTRHLGHFFLSYYRFQIGVQCSVVFTVVIQFTFLIYQKLHILLTA